MPSKTLNADPGELEKFNALAATWWDPNGKFRPLHAINSARTGYIAERAELRDARVLDIGCGGGILCEGLAKRGAQVTGIDLAESPLQVARLHAEEAGLPINYELISAEALAERAPEGFDAVCCMEMLEHVPDPASTVAAAARLVRPGGALFFATINRNAYSWLTAIVAAEYILSLLPRGTHEYARLIRPAELAGWAEAAGLSLVDLSGMHYNPLTGTGRLTRSTAVNYIICCSRA
ncbi:MAG: bifunctional 2-polyprenyl-6-hydroxyphenol methylase/3-demethylubiquinol 3-O-methyltransferase UbiG [Gammaproteobacteria bacterium AqS3]|nr:bifunctional 2-polyprenyl-6-hydroxyphenol methylase/3-demethylubiquinol 3-O-methyltransferase UbiG [Gammaproteobacteria bacterium AqS3]